MRLDLIQSLANCCDMQTYVMGRDKAKFNIHHHNQEILHEILIFEDIHQEASVETIKLKPLSVIVHVNDSFLKIILENG